MSEQVRIESKGDKFAVVLEHIGSVKEMDVRDTYRDAQEYAFYLAGLLKLEVFYKGQKISGRKG